MVKKIGIFLIVVFGSSGQKDKAQTLFNKALLFLKQNQAEKAQVLLEETVAMDTTFVEAYFKLGSRYLSLKKEDKARDAFRQVYLKSAPNADYVLAYNFLGTDAFQKALYGDALKYFETAKLFAKPNSPLEKQLIKQISNAAFGVTELSKAIDIKFETVACLDNFAAFAYFPNITADNSTLIFTARSETGDENIFVSQKNESCWSTPKSISKSINTPENEGTAAISGDGRTLVFTKCSEPNGCDLYISYFEKGNWSEPKNLGLSINSPSFESQPSLSVDGKTLFYVSDRYGGIGKKDIYMSFWQNNNWTKAVNLGSKINTPYDDIAPFIHPNSQTLFFSSEGHLNLGKLDLFFAESSTAGHFEDWNTPKNLGYPINDAQDQHGIFITADTKTAYYSASNAKKSELRQFETPAYLNLRKTITLNGIVKNAKTKIPIQAYVSLFGIKSQLKIEETFSNANGQFLLVLPDSASLGVHIESPDYFFKSMHFDLNNTKNEKTLEVLLDPIEKSLITTLNNIFFDTNSSSLKIESNTELDKLVGILKQNPNLKVEIAGHTDDLGSDEFNLKLSKERSRSVVNYCLSKGIAVDRLISAGYGETKPIVQNVSELARMQNRRIELKIL